ncbi:MAG TPA: peptidylprolyl isomerase [Terriglobales bacterium]|nr:peptidylprolyl isomerase [Terriglobales bacterium]
MKRLCLLLAALLLPVGPRLRADLVNGVEGVVHDSVVTHEEVQEMTEPAVKELLRKHPDQGEAFRKDLAEAEHNNLEQLMDRQLILHDFQTAGYSLPESVINDIVEERIHANPAFSDRRTLTKTLQAEGITYEKFRERIRDSFIIEQMRLKNVSSTITISPPKVEVYYADHREEFKVEDEVKLRMIVLNKSTDSNAPRAADLAKDILAQLKKGAPFVQMATIYSQGSARTQGGDWGWVGKSVLRKELADAAFKLKAGEVSDVIDTPEADYLMKVEDTKPAHYEALSEVRDQIEHNLSIEERSRLEKLWLEKLRKKTFMRYF